MAKQRFLGVRKVSISEKVSIFTKSGHFHEKWVNLVKLLIFSGRNRGPGTGLWPENSDFIIILRYFTKFPVKPLIRAGTRAESGVLDQ